MNFIYFLILINLISFLAIYIDKQKAKKQKWRIPESTLLFLTLIGGSSGTIISMHLFHHKTQKKKFYLVYLIFLLWLIFLDYLYQSYY